jgi:hypothetical protein
VSLILLISCLKYLNFPLKGTEQQQAVLRIGRQAVLRIGKHRSAVGLGIVFGGRKFGADSEPAFRVFIIGIQIQT